MEIIFWVCMGLLVYSYFIYPVFLQIFSSGRKLNANCFEESGLPFISILISVHNEEKIIGEKLQSVLNSNYPKEKIEVFIGDDASTDNTKEIVSSFQSKFRALKLFLSEERRGKPSVINDLVKQCTYEIVVLTDANILLEKDALIHLVKHFKNGSIGLTAAKIINHRVSGKGISEPEKNYISRENQLKYWEGLNWGTMIGPFGALYALRKSLYRAVPSGFIVDDFYICMNVLKQKKQAIQEPSSIGYEDVSEELMQEFRRKARISAGNFQNLKAFASLLNPFRAVGFCFFSHKVIRWFGPLLMLGGFISNFLLVQWTNFYFSLFCLQLGVLAIMLFEPLLSRMGVKIQAARYISYFCWMNLALLIGLFHFMRGIKSNVWQPTKRAA